MAVSKIAVMALVGILAVPILLGYALNLSEVTETDYKPEGEAVNVTDLLKTSTTYTYAHATSYQLNTSFRTPLANFQMLPMYTTISSENSSFPMERIEVQNWVSGGTQQLSPYSYFYTQFDYSSGSITATLYYLDSQNQEHALSTPITNFVSLYYDNVNEHRVYVTNRVNGNLNHTSWQGNFTKVIYSVSAGFPGSHVFIESSRSTTNTYADLSAGFHFMGLDNEWSVNLPDRTKSILMTINLDSITDSNYQFEIKTPVGNVTLQKTTTNGVVNWSAPSIADNLYYDPLRADNTYQLLIDTERTTNSQNTPILKTTTKLLYVGSWPTLFGQANYFNTYEKTTTSTGIDTNFNQINIESIAGYSPTIRMDDAYYRAFAYSTIENKEYSPADFKTNPSTTITSINKYGSSIEFGGNTYTVDNTGNITLGTHKVSVNGLKLESIPVPVGYENRINGNVISVSADPSTIKFNGQWGASVSTIGNTATTYTKTEWNAGTFAWDGIDTNFLIVGLITCLGAFIALGIYLRKTGKGLMPLLIVCGCAAGLFFCMI